MFCMSASTVVDLIDHYEKAGLKIRYLGCSEDDILPILDLVVTYKGMPVDVERFGSGVAGNFRFYNFSGRGVDDRMITCLDIFPMRL